jgi:hypothetical protein
MEFISISSIEIVTPNGIMKHAVGDQVLYIHILANGWVEIGSSDGSAFYSPSQIAFGRGNKKTT